MVRKRSYPEHRPLGAWGCKVYARLCPTSATSTPSRYALMIGMYSWKNKNAKILPGDATLIIQEEQYTAQDDVGQQENLSSRCPEKLEEMKAFFFQKTGVYYKSDVKEIELK